jgi:hypothetical protein
MVKPPRVVGPPSISARNENREVERHLYPEDTAVRSPRQIRWRVGLARFAVSLSPMSSMKIGGTNPTAICSDPLRADPD